MLLLPRLDWDAGEGRDKVSLRAPVNVFRRPDFIWSPYRNSAAPLESSVRGLAGSWIRSRRSGVAYELRAGLTSAGISVNRRAVVEEGRDWAVPLLTVNPGENLPCPDCLGEGMKLPGTLSAFGYDNQALNLELSGNILLQAGKHSWKLGSGWLRRRQSGGIRAGADGTYSFESLAKLATDQPSSVLLALPRSLAGEPQALRQVDDGHRYGQDQFFGFLQDSLRVWPRVYLNLGVRYENFGSPRSLSGSDVGLEFDPALPLSQALPGASLLRLSNIYRSDGNNIAGRLGFTVMLDKAGRSLLRAGGGTFFDRPIDNLWLTAQLNGQVRRDGRFPAGSTVDVLRYLPQLTPQTSLFSSLSALGSAQPEITAVAPNLRSAAAHHAFLGFELHWLPGVTVHLNGQTALGRGLVTTDLVNRVNSVTPRVGNATGRLFAAIPNNIAFRANQGTSAYYGANASIRWTGQRVNLLASYSLSHLLDNQSESLAGDFFDLRATAGNTPGERYVSAFTRQFNSGADRARSDFDQRHNLTAAAILLLPGRRWRSGWSLAPIAAVRSGFPFTVLGQEAGGNPFAPTIANNRANLLDPVAARVNQAVNGGRVLLNEAAFSPPGRGSLGTSGRNNFRGPGFVSLDLSLAKAMQWRESRLTLRADAYNIANHQNLGAPSAYLGGSCRTCFGFAPVGRTGRTGQSLQVPFQETPRQIQLLLRVEF